jgi:pre-rRNA-processing protein TSR2
MNLRSGLAVGAGVLQDQRRPQFEEGVQLILSKWTALQLAVEQEWGGRQSRDKAEEMLDEVLDWFYKRKGTSLCAQMLMSNVSFS